MHAVRSRTETNACTHTAVRANARYKHVYTRAHGIKLKRTKLENENENDTSRRARRKSRKDRESNPLWSRMKGMYQGSKKPAYVRWPRKSCIACILVNARGAREAGDYAWKRIEARVYERGAMYTCSGEWHRGGWLVGWLGGVGRRKKVTGTHVRVFSVSYGEGVGVWRRLERVGPTGGG